MLLNCSGIFLKILLATLLGHVQCSVALMLAPAALPIQWELFGYDTLPKTGYNLLISLVTGPFHRDV